MGELALSKCKEGEFESIAVINFGFMEESSDVTWPQIYLKKDKVIKIFSAENVVKILLKISNCIKQNKRKTKWKRIGRQYVYCFG